MSRIERHNRIETDRAWLADNGLIVPWRCEVCGDKYADGELFVILGYDGGDIAFCLSCSRRISEVVEREQSRETKDGEVKEVGA